MTWQGHDQLAHRQHYEHYNLSDRFLIMHEKPCGQKPMFKPAKGSQCDSESSWDYPLLASCVI